MKGDGRRWGWQIWMGLAVGAWLGAGLGAGEPAEAAATLTSGLLKGESGGTHCAVVNIGGSSFANATRRMVRFGCCSWMRRAIASSAATPLALSSAPGEISTES